MIGAGTVIHPKAKIISMGGPIVIGSNCIIEEGVFITNRRKEIMRIGDDNLFEIGCQVDCPYIGHCNTISTRARVPHTVQIGDFCTIGSGCTITPLGEERLPNYTVIYGPASERRTWSGRGRIQELDLRRKHAEYLRETLPRFNRLRKSENSA